MVSVLATNREGKKKVWFPWFHCVEHLHWFYSLAVSFFLVPKVDYSLIKLFFLLLPNVPFCLVIFFYPGPCQSEKTCGIFF